MLHRLLVIALLFAWGCSSSSGSTVEADAADAPHAADTDLVCEAGDESTLPCEPISSYPSASAHESCESCCLKASSPDGATVFCVRPCAGDDDCIAPSSFTCAVLVDGSMGCVQKCSVDSECTSQLSGTCGSNGLCTQGPAVR